MSNPIINLINHCKASDLVEVYGLGANDIYRSLRDEPITCEDELFTLPFAEELIEWAEMKLLEKEAASREVAAEVLTKRLQNRARYLFEPVLKRYETSTGRRRWLYDPELRSGGLLPLTLQYLRGRPLAQPASMQVLNCLPPTDFKEHDDIAPHQWGNLSDNGFVTSGERVIWNRSTEAFEWIVRMFDLAIDARAHNHSLNSPTYIDLHDVPIRCCNIKTTDERMAGVDGSGRIHPDHELFEIMNRPGGPCVVQFRLINQKGLFAKGVFVPDERCVNEDGEPEIWLDWGQIKGRHKKIAKAQIKKDGEYYTNCHIGVIRVWDRRSSFNWGFEVLENLAVTPENEAILRQFTEESMDKLFEGGVNRILAKVCQDDPKMALTIKLMTRMQALGAQISPLQIPTIRGLVAEKLGRQLYRIAQGTGRKSRQMVCVIDAGVPEGKVVIRGYKPGTRVACFRFPIVLAQGLATYEVAEPLPHHLVNGKIVRETIFMNPKDLFNRHQGDDDGDTMAVDNDPRVIELFERVNDHGVYLIEPEGTKFNIKTDTPEGHEYMRGNPRGPVGIMTIHRAKLEAVGDLAGARAMSLLIQEVIDQAKRKVEYSDWRKAVDLANWDYDEETGTHTFNIKLSKNHYVNGELPEKMIAGWVNARLRAHGVVLNKELWQNPVAWRHEGKRIDPLNWSDTYMRSNGFDGGNLVHRIHDYALHLWRAREDQFFSPEELGEIGLGDVLPTLLALHGYPIVMPELDWESYRNDLRERSGIRQLGVDLAKAHRTAYDDETRHAKIEEIHQNLYSTLRENNITLQELSDIWVMETTCEEGNINNAFRAIAWTGSPVLKALGIEWAEGCPFLTPERSKSIVDWCANKEDPFNTLANMLYNSTKHAEEVKDEGGHGIPGYECAHCMEQLQNGLIRKIRADKKRDIRAYMGKLITNLNNPEKHEEERPSFG